MIEILNWRMPTMFPIDQKGGGGGGCSTFRSHNCQRATIGMMCLNLATVEPSIAHFVSLLLLIFNSGKALLAVGGE